MFELDVVDAHHHLWDLVNSYPWLQERAGDLQVHGDDSALRRNYLVEDLRRDADGLRLIKSVHVDAGAGDPLVEARWLQAIADTHGFPHAIVAGARLADPSVAEHLEAISALPNARGVRDILNWHPDPKITYIDNPALMMDTAWLAGFERLAGHGLSFDLQVYPHQLADAARLATEHESTRIVLNHAGMPVDRDDDSMRVWRDGLRRLASLDNLSVKISGIGMTDHRWSEESIRPIVLECVRRVRPESVDVRQQLPGGQLVLDLHGAIRGIRSHHCGLHCRRTTLALQRNGGVDLSPLTRAVTAPRE